MHTSNQNHVAVQTSQDYTLATEYAAELIELFRSMKGSELSAYLQSATYFSSPVPLCAHINILDRTTGTIYNPDSLATLPPNSLDRGTPQTNSNRYYSVQVVDPATLSQLATGIAPANCTAVGCCGQTGAITTGPAASPTALFLVSVSVTFVPRGRPIAEAKRVVLSTLVTEP